MKVFSVLLIFFDSISGHVNLKHLEELGFGTVDADGVLENNSTSLTDFPSLKIKVITHRREERNRENAATSSPLNDVMTAAKEGGTLSLALMNIWTDTEEVSRNKWKIHKDHRVDSIIPCGILHVTFLSSRSQCLVMPSSDTIRNNLDGCRWLLFPCFAKI